MTDPTNHPANPYESPTVESEGATAGSEGAGFRWRLIPTAVLGLLGVCGVSCGLFAAVYVLIAFHVEGLSWVTVQMIAAMLIYLTPGILLLMAARYCWTGRTRAALIATALAAIVPPFLLAIFDN